MPPLVPPVDDVRPDHWAATAAVLAGLPQAHIATGCPRKLYICRAVVAVRGPGRPARDIEPTDEGVSMKPPGTLTKLSVPPLEGHIGTKAPTTPLRHGTFTY